MSKSGRTSSGAHTSAIGRRSLLTGGAAVVGGAAVTAAVPTAVAQAAPQGVPAPGAVTVRPGDGRYPDLVRGVNQRWCGAPEYVRLVTSTEHVVAAVQEAVDAGKRVAVRSGGHCYENFVYHQDVQVVIDMSAMADVYFDPARHAFAVEAGASNLNVYEALYKLWGVALPAGSCYSVSAGGHISGGGYGLLSRLHGLTVDHLYGVEVVVVGKDGTARAVVATREADDPNRELWWAHTGAGGGNFGVITRYWLRSPGAKGSDPSELLPKPPSEVFVHATALKWDDVDEAAFARLLRNWGTWHERNSAPDSPYNSLFGLLKLTHRSSGQIGLVTQMDATVPDAQRLLNDYLAAVHDGVSHRRQALSRRMGEHAPMPEFAAPRRLPWFIATDSLSGALPAHRAKYKSAYMRKGFTDAQISALYKHLTREDYANPDALVQIDSYGGRINAVAPGDTAVAQRDSVLKLQYQTYWTDPAEDERHLSWIRELYRDVYATSGGVPVPDGVNDGCYINYPDTDLGDPAWNTSDTPWTRLYYKDNYARLQRVKADWDPRDVFRHAQSVRLP
ncbi:FAD-binding oxidoreductase [Streptomyces gamaensis]|uniref:FAD-binding oxidoreductase n=1 Tax=Streptomyces gamaensis TaxID=1763542 RepID=A0ABW0Z0I7_9ACTN